MVLSLEVLVELLVFSSAALMALGVMREMERKFDQRRRLAGQGPVGQSQARPLMLQGISENAFFRWVLKSTSISNSEERDRLRQALILAGFDNPNAPIWYVIARFSLAILLPGIFIMMQLVSAKPVSGFGIIFWPVVLCCVGLIAPSRILANLAASRQADLEGQFPDALDLMVVCVEAGLTIDAAFVRVGNEIWESHPAIAREFEKVSEQLRAGRARPDALRVMANRTGVSAIKSFVALLIQTEMLGASIAQTLRTFSSEMRQTRFVRAEEKAMRIPVMMTIPLVVFILPVIVTALMLPPMIDVVRTLMPALMHHHGGVSR
jgi:tight adherence protein C